jgi:hypothetical protein
MQLTLVQSGEFIVCDNVSFESGTITATTSLPVNTMKAVSVRIDNDIVPLPFIRSQDRRAVSARIRIDGPIAARIAKAMGLSSQTA